MRWTTTFRLRLRSLFRSGRVEQELGEELQYHLAHLVDDYVAAGMSVADARDAARREMGAIEQSKEECRDARGVALADSIHKDLTYALRALRKSPAFASVAILSLALGIGANPATFTLWNGVLRAPLPGVRAQSRSIGDALQSWRCGTLERPHRRPAIVAHLRRIRAAARPRRSLLRRDGLAEQPEHVAGPLRWPWRPGCCSWWRSAPRTCPHSVRRGRGSIRWPRCVSNDRLKRGYDSPFAVEGGPS